MSEQVNDHEYNQPKYEDLLAAGLIQAQEEGFDLNVSLHANYAEQNEDIIIARAQEVTKTAVEIAKDAELSAEFFSRTANTILLTAIADSLVDTHGKQDLAMDYDPKIGAERAMLADALLMIAGTNSGVAESMDRSPNAKEYKRYIPVPETNPKRIAREKFLESLYDLELAETLNMLLKGEAANTFLAEQMEIFGVTAETQEEYRVNVIKMASEYSLANAGVIDKVKWPDWSENLSEPDAIAARSKAGQQALEHADRNKALAKPYVDAEKEYEERFGTDFGSLAPAFVNIDMQTGVKTLNLLSDHAWALINLANPETAGRVDKEMARIVTATIQHEYAHTQKDFLLGPHHQIGRILEERKAEAVSHDQLGYQDIKHLITDMSAINEVLITGMIRDSLKDPDALSSLLVKLSNGIGLRNTLLLMVSRPTPYEKDPDILKEFPDLTGVKRDSDESAPDALLRDNMNRKGGEAQMKLQAAAVAGRIATKHGANGAAFMKGYVQWRSASGVTATAKYYEEAAEGLEARQQ